jgi:chitinase
MQGDKLTHINYAFANIAEGRVVEGNSIDSVNFQALHGLKSTYPHLKILVSVGGWARSDHFSDAALTTESRETFAQSALEFMLKYKLDGVDLDWEYPGQLGEDNLYRPEDKQNFTLLLAAVRGKLDAQSDTDGRNDSNRYLLTIATGANQTYLDHTNMSEAHQHLDYVNIMTYDYFTGGSATTGHHTNLHHSSTSNSEQSSAEAVEEHIAAGIPVSKLVLGAAFYGRGWKEVENKEQFLSSPHGDGFVLTYRDLTELIDKEGFVRHWDHEAKAPYLWNADSATVITYDDPESLKHKCVFISDTGLAGIMFWEYSQDKEGELLDAINTHLTE